MAAQHSRYGDYSTRYRFNGKEQDEATGFYYYGARYYAPSLSRWLSTDPLAEKHQGFSPYNYTLNNPIMFVDPDGRSVDDWVEKDGEMMYDNRVTNQEDATALYGEGTTYRPNGYSYTSSDDGSNITLGDYGFFKSNGTIESSPDLAKNSLAYTDPTQSLANAESQISTTRENYTNSAGVVGFITTDAVVPEPSDAAWPKWVGYAVVGVAAGYYVAKMEREIAGIRRRSGGSQGVQYSLRATSSGNYTCYTC